MNEITLLGISPSGDRIIVRDPSDRVWLLHPDLPESPGAPRQLREEQVDLLVESGMVRVDVSFESWEALDSYRQERVGARQESVLETPLGPAGMKQMLAVAHRWRKAGEARRAESLALKLLRESIVAERADLREEILSLIEESRKAQESLSVGPVAFLPGVDPTRAQKARERFQRRNAAA